MKIIFIHEKEQLWFFNPKTGKANENKKGRRGGAWHIKTIVNVPWLLISFMKRTISGAFIQETIWLWSR